MKLKIDGIEGYDGEYEFDLDDFNQRELADVEKLSGVPFSKWLDGYLSVTVAIAAALLKRSGKPVIEDMLWDAPVGAITVLEEKGADAGPPEQSPTLSPVGERNSSASNGSETTSETPESLPKGTGDRGSATTSPSAPPISAISR